jgi:hypothetical protein
MHLHRKYVHSKLEHLHLYALSVPETVGYRYANAVVSKTFFYYAPKKYKPIYIYKCYIYIYIYIYIYTHTRIPRNTY